MSKSIKSMVLECIKKQEAEQRQNKRDKVYKALEQFLDKLVEKHVLLRQEADRSFEFCEFTVSCLPLPDTKLALQDLGCIDVQLGLYGIFFSVPMWDDGKDKSPAQMLIFNYIKRTEQWQAAEKVKEERKINVAYDAIIGKLKNNEFVLISSDNDKYEIKIEMGLPALNSEGIEKLSKMLLREEFTLTEYCTSPNFIRLVVYK